MPTDPEILKIPAFMRKRSLSARQRKPLILTALDRKLAGLPPEGLKPKRKKPAQRKTPHKVYAQELPFFDATQFKATKEKKVTSRRINLRKRKTKLAGELRLPKPEFFSPPVIDAPEIQTQKPIGRIIHYYDKIKVGVIDVAKTISVGDCISYETADGESYEQIIESMEINRAPVFSAKKGDDIGLKLRKIPQVGCKVYAV
ncbi:hypothetical protein HZC21_06135 [Candidatus Peregrinibacteria bacterium]|nr:hypothetical protein [Candidatus Peregrinibacteria bacterium]